VPMEVLKVAVDVASGVAEAHLFVDGMATLAHADLKPEQFLLADGVYKINDFNCCRFLTRSRGNATEACPFQKEDKWKGRYRSPEELNGKNMTEKIDVFALGGILYYVLTGKKPFALDAGPKKKGLYDKIRDGDLPFIPSHLQNSTHPAFDVIFQSIQKCWAFRPEDRPSSKQIHLSLLRVQKKLELRAHQ